MANVMIVDDSIIIRNRLKALLVKCGHQVVAEAQNGIQAVRYYKEYRPDVLTMDITMPEMDGITALKKILEVDSNAKVIMLSAISQKLLVLEALKSGAKHFVVKPIEDGKLEQVIEEVLESKTPGKNKSPGEAGYGLHKAQEDTMALSQVSSSGSILFEHINGVIVVKFVQKPTDEEIRSFLFTVNSILKIRNLHVMLDFEGINSLDEDFCKEIDQVLSRISLMDGEYILSSINNELKTCIQKYNLQYFRHV